MKGSVAGVSSLAESIGMQPALLRSLLSVTNGKLDDIAGYLPSLARSLGINRIQAVDYLLRLAHGDGSVVNDIS